MTLPLVSAEALRARRESLGMSQQDLAVACGCTRMAVSHLELGRMAGAFPDLATTLAWRLGLPLGEVFVVPEHARVDVRRRVQRVRRPVAGPDL